MAEMVVVSVTQVVKKLISESINLPNARSVGLARSSWTRDAKGVIIPELKLNISLLGEAFLQMLATGLGTLALVWATVVLLGGFSTMLVKMDFWFITAIVFIETARIVGYNPQPEAKFFIDVPFVSHELGKLTKGASKLVGTVTMGPVFFTTAPIYGASAFITLSIMRLVAITRHDYRDSDADTTKVNLKPALILFYSLVLTQGTLFLMWLGLLSDRQELVARVSSQIKMEKKEKRELIDKYVMGILDTCIDKGVKSTINRNLVSFVADLLQSEHFADHASAVALLHALISAENRAPGALLQIGSSQDSASKLVQMLSSTRSYNGRTKELTAEIVAKLANDLHLAEIPGATRSISSLLDTRVENMETARDLPRNNKRRSKKPLIAHGLFIFAELAGDLDNCREIHETKGLIPKILAPVSHGLLSATGNDSASTEIVKASLGVVAKLVNGTGEISTMLREEISCNRRAAENILWILRNSSDQDMKILAVQSLTKLHGNCELIFEAKEGTQFPVIQQVTILSCEDSHMYRTATAELMAQICAHSVTEVDRNRLIPISNALSAVLKAIFDIEITETLSENTQGETDNEDPEEENQSSPQDDTERQKRIFLSSCIGLTMQICNKLMITGDDFRTALAGIPLDIREFVKKLKKIVEFSNHGGDIDSLVIIKRTANLATWMMEKNHSYIQYFNQENILQELNNVVNAMPALEKCMILTGTADEARNYKPLSELVEEVKGFISQAPAESTVIHIPGGQ